MREKLKFLLEAILISGVINLIIVLYYHFSISWEAAPGGMVGIDTGFVQNIPYLLAFGSFLVLTFWLYYTIERLNKRKKTKE